MNGSLDGDGVGPMPGGDGSTPHLNPLPQGARRRTRGSASLPGHQDTATERRGYTGIPPTPLFLPNEANVFGMLCMWIGLRDKVVGDASGTIYHMALFSRIWLRLTIFTSYSKPNRLDTPVGQGIQSYNAESAVRIRPREEGSSGRGAAVADDVDFFAGDEAVAHDLVEFGEEGVDAFLFVDDLDEDGEVFAEAEDFGGVEVGVGAEAHGAAEDGGAGEAHFAGFEDDGFVEGLVMPFVEFAEVDAEE